MKKKHVIVGSLLVIGAIMVGSSLAWWTWSTSTNEQTNVVVTVGVLILIMKMERILRIII